MTAPLPTSVQHLRVNMDAAVKVAQYASFWDLDVYEVQTTAHRVTVHVGSVDHGQRLAAGFDLNDSHMYEHRHGSQDQVHTRWRGAGPVEVICVMRAEAVA